MYLIDTCLYYRQLVGFGKEQLLDYRGTLMYKRFTPEVTLERSRISLLER